MTDSVLSRYIMTNKRLDTIDTLSKELVNIYMNHYLFELVFTKDIIGEIKKNLRYHEFIRLICTCKRLYNMFHITNEEYYMEYFSTLTKATGKIGIMVDRLYKALYIYEDSRFAKIVFDDICRYKRLRSTYIRCTIVEKMKRFALSRRREDMLVYIYSIDSSTSTSIDNDIEYMWPKFGIRDKEYYKIFPRSSKDSIVYFASRGVFGCFLDRLREYITCSDIEHEQTHAIQLMICVLVYFDTNPSKNIYVEAIIGKYSVGYLTLLNTKDIHTFMYGIMKISRNLSVLLDIISVFTFDKGTFDLLLNIVSMHVYNADISKVCRYLSPIQNECSFKDLTRIDKACIKKMLYYRGTADKSVLPCIPIHKIIECIDEQLLDEGMVLSIFNIYIIYHMYDNASIILERYHRILGHMLKKNIYLLSRCVNYHVKCVIDIAIKYKIMEDCTLPPLIDIKPYRKRKLTY